ncbi:iron-containing alcohol dehydrogenase family protein [Clostridium sp. CTA-5]
MKYSNQFLPNYTVGEESYKAVSAITGRYGKKAVVIGGKTAILKSKDVLLEGIKNSEVRIIDFVWYGGNSSYENVDILINNENVKNADMIYAVGGGRAIDTCKVVSDKLNKPLFSFPTIASNCAACTCISVIYNTDDTFREYYYPKTPADHTFINTKIIAEAPVSLLFAGIGDALSKEYEVLLAARKENLSHSPLMGANLSKACGLPLIEYGKKALDSCKNNMVTFELEQVALDIIISTGIVSNMTSKKGEYYYNSSLAHCVYYGATMVPKAASHLHGEIVAFGVLCLLTYDEQFEERKKIAEFNKSVGLPLCLDDINITKNDVKVMAQKASTVTEWTCAPYEITKEKFVKAILDTDDYGKSLK